MKVEEKLPFDPKIFLARVGAGKTRVELRKRQIVFSQGDPADAVFYIHKGKIELKVLSGRLTLGVGNVFRVSSDLAFDHSGKYGEYSHFEYSGENPA